MRTTLNAPQRSILDSWPSSFTRVRYWLSLSFYSRFLHVALNVLGGFGEYKK